jgi:hypothetical protein
VSYPEILVIVHGSPIVERTAGIVSNVLSRGAGLARVLVLTPGPWRGPVPEGWGETVALSPQEENWADQILRASRESGCRWLVTPSYMDRYLPGAFEAVAATAGPGDHTVIGPCLVNTERGPARIGPDPFTFDFYRLMFRQNYIAPGAVFLSAAQLAAKGGFDLRFPTAAALAFLLGCGADAPVLSVWQPLLETGASPFPGIPPEYAGRYAIEAALVAQEVNHMPFTPGTAASVAAALGDAMRLPEHAFAFGGDLGGLAQYLRDVAQEEVREDLGFPPPVPTRWQGLKWAVRGWAPRPVWKALKRSKRAYQAFTAPLQ